MTSTPITSPPPIRLAVLDLAGTTVADDGLVERAFTEAVSTLGVATGTAEYDRMLRHVRATMGESKIAVFRSLFGDESRARAANQAFEAAYDAVIASDACTPVPGAAETIARLRRAGIKVALTTGFARPTLDRLLDALRWREVADLTLTPAEAGRGRPYPDLVLTALLRLEIDDVRAVATAGDTSYDVLAGTRAGASIVAGVLTGAHDEPTLRGAGASDVIASVADLPALIGV